MKKIPFLLLAMLAVRAYADSSQAPDLNLGQLNHRLFTAIDGAPADISTLAQTPDGMLWLGGRAGLTRFDGVHFVPYPAASDEPLPGTNIAGLLATADGGLWIGMRPFGAALLKGGHVTRYGPSQGLPEGSVEQFAWDREGALWAATRRGLARFDGARWHAYSGTADIQTPYGMLLDRSGTFWVGALNGLFARVAGETEFRVIDSTLSFGVGGTLIVQAPDGRIYAAPHFKLVRVDQSADPRPGGAVTVKGVNSAPLLFDDAGNLWASEVRTKGILRVPALAVANMGPKELVVSPEALSSPDTGSGRVFSMLEDREHNVWVGTDSGLHRFSRSNVVRTSANRCYQYGFTAAAFVPGDDGTLWVACGDGADSRVDEYRDGQVVSSQRAPPFTAANREHDGTVWFGGQSVLARLVNGRIVVVQHLPVEMQGRPIAGMVHDRAGAMWVSVTRRSLYRIVDGHWTEYGGLTTLPHGWPTAMIATDDGVLWLGYPDNHVARMDGDNVQVFGSAQGLNVGNVLSIFVREDNVWVGGELGLARLYGARFATINGANTPFRGISGIVRARNGDLWLNGINGILRIAKEEKEAVKQDSRHRVVAEIFNYLDGVPGTAVQLRPQQSAVESTDGRIWFSMTAGIVSIDARQLMRNALPPPVSIWSVTSGSHRYPNLGNRIRLPVHTTGVEIEYAAGSLTIPERVRFQYRLEGLDHGWLDAGGRREARYTNLGPGAYRFRVKASNNDGVWNETGASIDFTIAPAFYQTTWFYVLCAFACLGMMAALYRIRVRQVAAQVRGRLEARLSERERIARELHDTLLQGMQGLIWKFQAAADRLPEGEPARQLLEESLDRADQLLGESRDKVKDLRPTRQPLSDIGQALAEEGEQFAQLHPAQFQVNVQGSSRDLHPIVREELLLIAREALANAFRHSGAKRIEAELTYGDSALHLRVRDDGRGISHAVLDEGGRPGHFGLVGMRERAKKLGARLEVWSKPGAGTEVDLRVPSDVAYRSARASAAERPALAVARKTVQGS